MKRFIICLIAFTQLSHGEDVTLVNHGSNPTNSETITLNQGDTAKLIYGGPGTGSGVVYCTIGSWTFPINTLTYGTNQINPIAIAGPATLQLRNSGDYVATFSITRAGIASPPAAIPQEGGTTWDVILESSSDLMNWTPANPGEYSGTEPKRFFRTRMVKKP